jgi:FtsZ-binding cell division protein ZapB
VSGKAANLEAALITAKAKIGSLQSRVRELHVENTSLTASLSAARAERNALNAAIK